VIVNGTDPAHRRQVPTTVALGDVADSRRCPTMGCHAPWTLDESAMRRATVRKAIVIGMWQEESGARDSNPMDFHPTGPR
jgi:hypothetical protein